MGAWFGLNRKVNENSYHQSSIVLRYWALSACTILAQYMPITPDNRRRLIIKTTLLQWPVASLIVFWQDWPWLSVHHLWAYSHLLVYPHVAQCVTHITVLGNRQLVLAFLISIDYLKYLKHLSHEWTVKIGLRQVNTGLMFERIWRIYQKYLSHKGLNLREETHRSCAIWNDAVERWF